MNLVQVWRRKIIQKKLMMATLMPSRFLKLKVIKTEALIVMNSVKID